MKKKGEQKSMTSIAASLTPDCKERKERNNSICHVYMLWTPSLVTKTVDSISLEIMQWTTSILTKFVELHFLLVKVVHSISHESESYGVHLS